LFVESKKIKAECIQFKTCFEAAIESEGTASCNAKERGEREQKSRMHSIESLQKDSEKRSRSRDSVGREIKGEGVLKPNDSVKSLLRIRDSVGRVSVK
jgi:hypothetical protein